MPVQLQLRRDTAASWTAANPILANGELGLEMDTGKIKIGNGADNWTTLAYWAGTGSPPTPNGTGFTHETAGVQDVNAKLVLNVDVDASAAIAESKLSLNYPTHPQLHHAAHQNGGADEVATATAGANAIPKAGAGGTLATGWIPVLPASQITSGQLALARGGSNADLSATGPGYLRQKTAGANITAGNMMIDGGLYLTPGSDCTSALQNLVTNAGSGATIVLPAGDIQISSTITVGDGTNAAAISTKQNIKIIGQATSAGGWWNGAGNAGNTATTLRWTGSTGSPMVWVKGQIGGVVLENLYLDGGNSPGADTLIRFTHMQSCEIRNVNGRRWGVQAYLVDSWSAGSYPAQNCQWTNVGCDHPWSTSANGLVLGAATLAASVGVSGYSFSACCFQTYIGGTGYGLVLRNCDSHTFINCYAGPNGVLVVAPSDANYFPCDITFYGCPLGITVSATSPAWIPGRSQSIQFFPFYTDDGEAPPVTFGIGGFTDNGLTFGRFSNLPLAYSTLSSGTAISNTNAQTAFGQTYSIPAGVLNAAGTKLRICALGHYSNTGTPTLGIWSGLGSATFLTDAMFTPSGVSNYRWSIVSEINVRTTGASASLLAGTGNVFIQGGTSGGGGSPVSGGQYVTPATVDLTAAQVAKVLIQWGAGSPSNTITMDSFTVEISYAGSAT